MRQDNGSSLELEREARAERAGISETLTEIRGRLSPGQLLDDVLRSSSARSSIADIGTKISRNPLPVVLIGAGLLWLAMARDQPEPATYGGRTRRGYGPRRGYGTTTRRNAVMAVSRENLTAWLRDAHAMENQAIEILEKQASRLESYPELRARVRTHLEESRRQADRVEHCLHQLGADTSAMKTAAGKLMGTAQQLSGLFASDEVLKSGIADYAFEHYEIASYKTLIAAANEAGEHGVRQTLEESLREEEAMAEWLSQHLPDVTRQYLHREAAGQASKV